MKKTLFTVALFACASTAFADWYWQGGATIDTESWGNVDNWNSAADGTGSAPAQAPATTGSNIWDKLHFDGVSGGYQDGKLEGWSLNLDLTNSSSLSLNVGKLQSSSSISVDASSSLLLNIGTSGYSYSSAGDKSFDIAGQVTLKFTGKPNANAAWNVTLRGNGTLNIVRNTATLDSSYTGFSSLTLNLSNSSLFTTVEQALAYEVCSVKVVGLSSENSSANMPIDATQVSLAAGTKLGELDAVLVSSADDLVADADHLGNYMFEVKDDGIYVNYVAAVPEPTTATLSLLALAGLCARRRRK